jgi:hypothetical protein
MLFDVSTKEDDEAMEKSIWKVCMLTIAIAVTICGFHVIMMSFMIR